MRKVCLEMRETRPLNRICLSGGCFQNLRLLLRAMETLRAEGFEVLTHRKVPANDEGISLGQTVIARELTHRQRIA